MAWQKKAQFFFGTFVIKEYDCKKSRSMSKIVHVHVIYMDTLRTHFTQCELERGPKALSQSQSLPFTRGKKIVIQFFPLFKSQILSSPIVQRLQNIYLFHKTTFLRSFPCIIIPFNKKPHSLSFYHQKKWVALPPPLMASVPLPAVPFP